MTRSRRGRPSSRGLWTLLGLSGILLALPLPAHSQLQLEFTEWSADAPAFSPNKDGVQDSLTISVQLSLPARLQVWIESTGDSAEVVRTLVDGVVAGTDLELLSWDGYSGPHPDSLMITEGTYRILAQADSGAAVAYADPLDVELDLGSPVHRSTVIEGDSLVYNGETIVIETTWDGADYVIDPDFTRIDSDTLGGLRKIAAGDTTQLIYTLSFGNTREDADSLRVPIRATDAAGNSTVDSTLMLFLRNAPLPLGSTTIDSVRTVHDGQTVVLLSRWNRTGYGLDADFTNVDNGTSGQSAVTDLGDGLYRITYTISEDNTVPDGDSLAVPITATTRFGDSFTDGSLYLCLSNHPPVHIASRAFDGRTVFKNGDTVRVETQWKSPAGLPIAAAGADFQGISTRFDLGEDSFAPIDDTTLVVTYRIPTSNEAADIDSVLIPTYGQDSGCGRSWAQVVRLSLDNTPPVEIPVVDALPPSTTSSRINVSGQVVSEPGAAVYRVGEAEDELLGTAEVDAMGRFIVTVTLIPGPQDIVARSLDVAGNPSEPSPAQTIALVEEAQIDIPKPFRTGDTILATRPGGWDKLDLRLINLEGTLVKEWSLSSPGRYVEIPWDGRNNSGDRVHSGPFLLIWEGSLTGGGRETKTLPLLYLR